MVWLVCLYVIGFLILGYALSQLLDARGFNWKSDLDESTSWDIGLFLIFGTLISFALSPFILFVAHKTKKQNKEG